MYMSHAVLEHLDRAYRHAELLALLGIFKSHRMRDFHCTAGLGALGGDCMVSHPFDQRQPGAFFADQRVGGNRDVLEIDL